MNLNKYTKAELISKFKNLQNKQSSNNSNNILNTLLYMKSILLKLTIFSILIRTFKKYSFFRRIWVILNTIVMTIFGISILDIYGISFISAFFTEFISIFGNIVKYLTQTQFYSVVSGLFASKIETPTKGKMRSIDSSPTAHKESVKISDWLNRKEEIIEKEDNSHKKYYVLLLMLLISTGLIWYYWPNFNWPGWPGWPTLPGWFGWPGLPSFFNRKPKDDVTTVEGLRKYEEKFDILPDTPKHDPDSSWWNMFNISKLWKSNKDNSNLSDNELQNRIKDLKAEAMNKAGESSKNIPSAEDFRVIKVLKVSPLDITAEESFINHNTILQKESLNRFNQDADSLAAEIK